MALVLTDSQEVTLTVTPVDKKGNPAVVDGVPTWGTSDDTVLTVAAAADGLTALVTATGKLGDAQINVSADADLGSGVTSLTGTLDVSVVAGQAATLGVTAGVPAEQP